jgi:putative phage-type endonuclease
MKFIDLQQGSKEWIEYRRTRIGASDSPVILGVSPFKTPFGLYEEKVYGKSVRLNEAMKRGTRREDEARLWLCHHFDMQFVPRIVEHKDHEWKFASLDALSYNNLFLVEIKWANSIVHSLAKKDQVVDYYYPQIQSQLACTGLDRGYFLSCFESPDHPLEFILVEVKRDNLFIEKMIEKEKEFYQRCIVEMQPPDMMDADYEHVKDNLHFDYRCAEYHRISKEIAALEKEKKSHYDAIIEMSSGRSCRSEAFKATKFTVKGNIEYGKIPQLKDVNLESFRKETREQWRIGKV